MRKKNKKIKKRLPKRPPKRNRGAPPAAQAARTERPFLIYPKKYRLQVLSDREGLSSPLGGSGTPGPSFP